jgi:serine/threonine protein phosphatase PrpC
VRQQRASGITSIVTDTVKQFGIAYDIHSWLRYLTWLAIASVAYLLLRISGGFPPPAWYLLLRTAPQIPHLFSMRGAAILFPLLGLVALSLTWLALWCVLLWAGLAAVRHWWYSTSSQQAQRRQKAAANAWQRSRPLSGNSNAKQVSTSASPQPSPLRGEGAEGEAAALTKIRGAFASNILAEAVLDPFEYAETNMQSKTSTGRCWHQSVSPTLLRSYPAGQVRRKETHPHTSSSPPPPLRGLREQFVHPSETLKVAVDDVGIGWDTGIVRRSRPNEDSLVALRSTCTHNGRILPIDLYVVADGMGGHSQGQEASRLAIQYMLQAVLSGILTREQLDDASFIKILVDAVQRANRVVHENSQADGIEMGTTITAALVFEGTAYVVNVGDSRTYIYRASDGKLSQVTRDHSLVARLVEAGAISRDEVYTHPDRNKVYRGLGEKGEVKVDWFSIPVQPGDHLVLCSDGLWEMVRDQEIERILKKHAANPPRASAALVEAALHGGGADNISVIVVRIG